LQNEHKELMSAFFDSRRNYEGLKSTTLKVSNTIR
jgi:hypothetical protein